MKLCSVYSHIITRFKHLTHKRLETRLTSNNKQERKTTGVNCALRQVKIEVQCSGRQVK